MLFRIDDLSHLVSQQVQVLVRSHIAVIGIVCCSYVYLAMVSFLKIIESQRCALSATITLRRSQVRNASLGSFSSSCFL